MDKVINIINNNYRSAFNQDETVEGNKENVNTNKQTRKKRTKAEKENSKSIEENKVVKNEVNEQCEMKTDSLATCNVSGNTCEVECVTNESQESKNDLEEKSPGKNTTENSCDNDSMDEDESFKFELDENLDVFTDIPEIAEDVEKGFEYFHTSKHSNKKSKEKLKKNKKRKKTDENLELLNEWRVKVSETRKNCKDIVNNLKLKTNLMKSKNNKYEIDWNNETITNGTNSVKKLNLPADLRKDCNNNIKALPTVRETVIKQKLVHSAKPVTVPYCKSPPLINSPIHMRKSPSHVRSTTFTKSPSPKSISPNRSGSSYSSLGSKSPPTSPHSSPRNSGSLFPLIKPNKSPENLFAVGMSLKCFNSNKDQLITA